MEIKIPRDERKKTMLGWTGENYAIVIKVSRKFSILNGSSWENFQCQ